MDDLLALLQQVQDYFSSLPTGGTLLSLLICGAAYFGFGYVFGWFASLIPVIRWIVFAYLLITMVRLFPTSINPYDMATYIFFGLMAPFVRRLLRQARDSGFALPRPSLRLPSLPRSPGGLSVFSRPQRSRPRFSFIRTFFGGIARLIGKTFRGIWKLITGFFYLLFVRIPARLVRLGFWLAKVIPTLNTGVGWLNLLKGGFAWIGELLWILLPPEIRAEFRRGLHGKTATQSMGQDIRAAFYREQARQKKRDERELWRFFGSFKKVFQQQARERKDPFAKGEPDLDPQRHQEEQRAQKQAQQAEQEARRKTQEAEKSAQRAQRSTSSQRSTQRTGRSTSAQQQASDDFFRQQRARTDQAFQQRQAERQAEQQRSKDEGNPQQKSTQNQRPQPKPKPEPKPRPKPKPAPEPTPQHDPASKAYYDQHKADFQSAGWDYSPEEDRFAKDISTYAVLGISSDADERAIKKAYNKISLKYGKFQTPNNPTPVQKRAHTIMCKVNAAKDTLIRSHKQKKRTYRDANGNPVDKNGNPIKEDSN